MDFLFSHVTAVTLDGQMRVLPDAFVGVTGGKISHLSQEPPQEQPREILDATGQILLPGLINCHTHLPQTILRGWADEVDERTRLAERIYPREERMDAETAHAAALLGIAESLRCGVTSLSSLDGSVEAVARA